eukprot:NODE_3094_length_831_cov_263.378866.p1 GENE.NODE_3094_length_831_cov_263.378866~~NODE_3094_length_831_cov_263.378866.p1  ORF type:complete len:193 (+),score=30.15 NODE_3094_length_831_cov_263.378866:71-580(+)
MFQQKALPLKSARSTGTLTVRPSARSNKLADGAPQGSPAQRRRRADESTPATASNGGPAPEVPLPKAAHTTGEGVVGAPLPALPGTGNNTFANGVPALPLGGEHGRAGKRAVPVPVVPPCNEGLGTAGASASSHVWGHPRARVQLPADCNGVLGHEVALPKRGNKLIMM